MDNNNINNNSIPPTENNKDTINSEHSNKSSDSSNNIDFDIEKLIADMEYYEKLKADIIDMQQSNNESNSNDSHGVNTSDSNTNASESSTSNSCDSMDLNEVLININEILLVFDSLKTQLYRIPLNPFQREYFAAYIAPLLTVMDSLSRTYYNIGLASASIAETKALNPNLRELHDNLDFGYCVARKCREVYCTLEKNINILICENSNTK